jgi:hypothetical protein
MTGLTRQSVAGRSDAFVHFDVSDTAHKTVVGVSPGFCHRRGMLLS